MPPRRRPDDGRLVEARRTRAILQSDDPLHLTCDGCRNDVDLSAPGLRGLYAQRTAPTPQVEVLCPECDDNKDKAGKSSSSSSSSSSAAAEASSLTSCPASTRTDRYLRKRRLRRAREQLRLSVIRAQNRRFDTRFTPCMRKHCPRARPQPEACAKCDEFYAAVEAFKTFLMEQKDVVCTYCDRQFFSRARYCKPIRLQTAVAREGPKHQKRSTETQNLIISVVNDVLLRVCLTECVWFGGLWGEDVGARGGSGIGIN